MNDFSTKSGSDSIYLHTIIEEGHAALSVNPYLGYVFDPIPLVEGIETQEGSLYVQCPMPWACPSCGSLQLGHALT